MTQNNKIYSVWIFIVVTSILALALIHYFNISYPINVTTSNVSTELSVVGEGKVDAKPDSALVTAGMTISNATTVEDARRQIDTVSNALISSLQKLGITKNDIKTTNYSVNPGYSYDGGAQKATGFNADVTYSITVKNTDIVNDVVEAATKSGANQIGNISYSVAHPEKFREQARAEAIQNARDQAQKLASQLGIHLGRVTNIVESGSNNPGPVPYMLNDMKAVNSGGAAPQSNIQPGTETVDSTVTLYFEKN